MTKTPKTADITIRDVARALSISHTTVSRALADSPKISADMKARVRRTADELGYVPSASARLMRGSDSTVVGLVVPDIQNDFYATVAKVVADKLAARSMQLILSITEDDPVRELRELKAMLELRPAGMITVPSPRMSSEAEALLKSQRTVQLLRRHSRIGAPAVVIDEKSGIAMAARHLFDLGHRHIGFIGGGTETSTGRGRLEGFKDAHAALSIDPAFVAVGTARPDFGRQAVTAMMTGNNRPTGLVVASSELMLGALQALRSLRLRWPHDVSLVGYHDPAWFELADGGITTVRLPVADVAAASVDLILTDLVASDHSAPQLSQAADLEFSPSLAIRSSTSQLRCQSAEHPGGTESAQSEAT